MFRFQLIVSLVVALLSVGCGSTTHFRAVDAKTGTYLTEVSVQRKHTPKYTALRIEGGTRVEDLGMTNPAGEIMIQKISNDDVLIFDKPNYWPAAVHPSFPNYKIESEAYDSSVSKTGHPGIDAIASVKRTVHQHFGLHKKGRKAEKHGDIVLVPLYPISTGP